MNNEWWKMKNGGIVGIDYCGITRDGNKTNTNIIHY